MKKDTNCRKWMCVCCMMLLFYFWGVLPTNVSAESDFTETPARIEAAAASVLRLEVYNEEEERIATGSGFIAFDDRTLVTSRHLMINMSYVLAYAEDGACYRFADMITAGEESDLALCSSEESTGLPVLVTAEERSLRGSKVLVMASPLGFTNLVTTGVVSGYWQGEDTERILFTASVSEGSSGGAVFAEDGSVLGIVSGTYRSGQNLNLAVPIEYARELYESR